MRQPQDSCRRSRTTSSTVPGGRGIAFALSIAMLLLGAGRLQAQVVQDSLPELRNIDVVEHLGESVLLDLVFTNDAGETVKLGDYFHHGKPVILVLAYYTCPMLCTMVLNGVSDAVKALDWQPGKEFQILTISIDPSETAELAAGKKARYLDNLGKKGVENGWRFFVGAESQSKALADAVDRIILYCYHYDPSAKGYVAMAGRIMRLGGALTLIILAAIIGTLWARERLRRSAARHA